MIHNLCDRRGATIIEVLFAVGVLLFGLVGIAAMIPAAAKLARSSMALDRGSAIGKSVSAEFESRGFADSSRWFQIDDSGLSASLVPTTGTSVCIDPLFVSRPENFVLATNPPLPPTRVGLATAAYEPASAPNHNYFRRNLFPYYGNNYNPLVDPAAAAGSADWPATPRLNRVTVTTAGGVAPPAMAASDLVDDIDQLVFEMPEDKTLPPTQIFRPGTSAAAGTTPFPATRTGRSEYSWITTIQPSSSGFGRASIAVISDRDRTFVTPPSGTPLVNIGLEDPRDLQERVAWVRDVVGGKFVGGAGGTVTLTATQAVKSDLEMGGWVMLIRNTGTISVPNVVHAWYRIVHADREATLTTINDPVGGASRPVWQRSVTIEGPDWIFNEKATVADDTFAVLVDGVVAVHEFPVHLGH